MEYDYGHSDSSAGTDDDIPPHASQMPREGRGSGNGRATVQKTQYGRLQNDQIHWFEEEAYCCVLRAFKAQSDAITWEKEALLSQLRKELRVSDEEHRELLGKVSADGMLRQMREWRQSGGNQPGFITNVISSHGPTPSPTVSASQKKQKSAHVMPKMHLQPPLPNLHNSPVPSSSGPLGLTWNEEDSARVRGKKSKGRSQANVLQMAKTPQVAVPGRDQIVLKRPPGRSSGKSQSTALPNIDLLIGRKVMTRWPQDNRFYEATITSYDADNGTHALVYDINTDHETWEWVNLKEMSPSDIRWDGPVPEGFGRGAIKKSIGCGVILSQDGNGRDPLKGQSTIDHRPSQNRTGRNGMRDIELRQTDRLLKEVERVVAVNYPDPVNVERAKKLLKEHELCLLEAIERLSEVSDGENDGWNPPSSRTHSVDHVRIQSRQNRRNKNISGDEYDTTEDGRGEHSDGEPFVGQYGAPSDDVQDNDEYG
ncbi:protein EMSY-LIKE 3 isoform X3 [Cryptomeria japonica]|uniref:protein EMSY-LIKE 3 isoform X3 n=1 Tax=Cryptomeria japonica TaxID=3369 RepID=UPI0027DA6D22|nr:protein EMSY-LIKE 3 isoform X3 [Cryptomeria japonica]